jgi:hypothetical protein
VKRTNRRIERPPELADQGQRTRQRHPGGERPFAGTLDDRAIGERVGERHTHFDDVGAAAGHRGEHAGRAFTIGIAGGDVGHQAAPFGGLDRREARGET